MKIWVLAALSCIVMAAATTTRAQVNPSSSETASVDPRTADVVRRMEAGRKASLLVPDTVGSGRYPAAMTVNPGLPNHVTYSPADLNSMGSKRLGVVIWGNGGCTDDGASARLHLAEIASHGYLVIAPGKVLSGPSMAPDAPYPGYMTTSARDMLSALDWAIAENSREGSKFYHRIDTKAVAVSGHSCGGILSIQVSDDPRIKTIIIHNSGVFPNTPLRPMLITDPSWTNRIHTPILYIIGNPSDVGHPVAMADYARINRVPIFIAEMDTDHSGTFDRPNGGLAAQTAVAWLEWRLRGDVRMGQKFKGPKCGLCIDPQWKVLRKNFNHLTGPH